MLVHVECNFSIPQLCHIAAGSPAKQKKEENSYSPAKKKTPAKTPRRRYVSAAPLFVNIN